MDFIVKDLDSNYRLDAFRNKADKIIFEISSGILTANCPYCGKESKRIHSRYQREVQDLPIQGKKVVLLVLTRITSAPGFDTLYSFPEIVYDVPAFG